MQHSSRRICSAMSKWVPFSSAMALSASCCIQSRKASLPGMRRAGSASSAATASSMLGARAGDLARTPPASRSPAGAAPRSPRRTSRAGPPWRRGSTARPARTAPGRPPASSRPRGRQLGAQELAEVGGRRGRRGGAPPRARRPARRRPGPGRPARGRSCRGAGSVQASHCSATASICARALTWPASAASRSVRLYCSTAPREGGQPGGDVGRGLLALGRHQVEDHPQAVQRRW